MSSKKSTISNEFSSRLLKLMRLLGYKERENGKFAKKIGITNSYLSDVLNLKSGPSFSILSGIANNFAEININWLLTGDGDPYTKEGDLASKASGEDPKTTELLEAAKRVLESGNTDSANTLEANIRHLDKALQEKESIDEVRKEFKQKLHDELAKLRKKLEAKIEGDRLKETKADKDKLANTGTDSDNGEY